MRRELVLDTALLAAAIACGWVGWSGHVLLLPVAAAFPVLWSQARNRRTAAFVSSGYFLAASQGLPRGVATFYASDALPGLLFWFVASMSFVAVHTVLWSRHQKWLPGRYLVAAVLMALPPFGITGWAHPVTASGVLFPGWGWYGLVATTTGLMGLVSRMSPAIAVALAGCWLWSAVAWTDPDVAQAWRGVDLEMGSSLGREAGLQRQRDLLDKVRISTAGEIRFVVLPESTLGFWTPGIARLWKQDLSERNVTVIAGATVIDVEGYDNVLVAIDRDGGQILYRERMPVPGSMWQPWRSWFGQSGGARAYIFANPVIAIGPTKIAPLICYEQLIIWPILQSMLFDPDVIVAVGNGWWATGTGIVAVQRSSTIAWARLFAKPLVLSFNT